MMLYLLCLGLKMDATFVNEAYLLAHAGEWLYFEM